MVSLPTLILAIIVLVILYNVFTAVQRNMASRNRYRNSTERSPAKRQMENWEARDRFNDAALRRVDEALAEMKSELAQGELSQAMDGAAPVSTKAKLSPVSFADVPPAQRKAEVMRYFNPRRGHSVRIKTTRGQRYNGTITSITGTQVMLRDVLDDRVKGVDLNEIEEVVER